MYSLYCNISFEKKVCDLLESQLTKLETIHSMKWVRTTPALKVVDVYRSNFDVTQLPIFNNQAITVSSSSIDLLLGYLRDHQIDHVVRNEIFIFRNLSTPNVPHHKVGTFIQDWLNFMSSLNTDLTGNIESSYLWDNTLFQYNPKIDIRGHYLPFSGSTVISNCVSNSKHNIQLHELNHQLRLGGGRLQEYYTMLPLDSYHVTICNLTVAQSNEKDTHLYSRFMSQNNKTLHDIDTLASKFGQMTCRITGCYVGETISLLIEFPQHTEELQLFRREIQKTLNVDDSALQFHLTLAYKFRTMSSDKIQTCQRDFQSIFDQVVNNVHRSSPFTDPQIFDVHHPTVCTFNDMTAFLPITGKTFR